ncbi:MAG TPA: NADPH-dependent assimilatory sulfite reductase hemoprotein subunit [Methylomirabilota bacterium]|nr:NADPH-dependent assimilatory sulfite reductase hemoprotein subunit [Methylomirabilota bacterium]
MSESTPVGQTSKPTHNEEIKAAIPTLAGNIAATMSSGTDQFAADDQQFLKFHGIYQQDDRDLRKTQKKFIMMIRGRIPGGVMNPTQWITFDDLATRYGNNTLRVTTRQSIQFHGVIMSGLGPLVKKINESLLSTLAACGDVNRNITASCTPSQTEARAEMMKDCHLVVDALAPKTKAYHSIWIDGVQLSLDDSANKDFVDPLYGKTYLPRKFKTCFVLPPVNDMDLFTNDLGFIAIVENGKLVGYNLCVGGGMGRSHGNEQTFPRLADVVGYFSREHVVEVAKAVLTIHRDFGDRTDRKHARLKYVVAERGVDFIRDEVSKRAGITLQPARDYKFTTTGDLYGWHKAVDGSWFFTLYVETGRIKDQKKLALRRIAEKFPSVEFRLSANQNVIVANITEADKAAINEIWIEHAVHPEKQASVLHAAAMACPALPTCGLALAESERMLPGLIDRIERLCGELGLGGEEIIIRSTGCPNGCARPYMAEIAFVGKAPGRYQLWLGGNEAGTRLNRIWKDVVKDPEIETELRPLLSRFATERNAGERFGDWAARVLWNETAQNAAPALATA